MSSPITFRPSAKDEQNLALLTRTGLSRSDGIRQALDLAAQQGRRKKSLVEEARRIAGDPTNQPEI